MLTIKQVHLKNTAKNNLQCPKNSFCPTVANKFADNLMTSIIFTQEVSVFIEETVDFWFTCFQ